MSYLDYVAYLSAAETLELHDRFRLAASAGVFPSPQWRARIGPELAELDDVLVVRADAMFRFRVAVYEWESGY